LQVLVDQDGVVADRTSISVSLNTASGCNKHLIRISVFASGFLLVEQKNLRFPVGQEVFALINEQHLLVKKKNKKISFSPFH